jgi:hypothetical protein
MWDLVAALAPSTGAGRMHYWLLPPKKLSLVELSRSL